LGGIRPVSRRRSPREMNALMFEWRCCEYLPAFRRAAVVLLLCFSVR
jgi:hypothetical protein